MQLPTNLQHFSKPTLIVVGDSVNAHFWLAGGDALQKLDGISLPRERMTDNEGGFSNTDNGSSGGAEPKVEEERLHHFVHLIQEQLEELIREHKAERIQLVMNAELAHAVMHHLPGDLQGKIEKQLHEDLMKDDIIDVLERLRKA